jgi:putative tryptophan/tyrosine transport system substrate-binding protein
VAEATGIPRCSRLFATRDGCYRLVEHQEGADGSPARMDPAAQARWGAMRDGLAKLCWIEGRNVQFDVRFSEEDSDRVRDHADELVRLALDVIAVSSGVATRALLQGTQTIPIIFTNVGDPVAARILKNIARPEGNTTGITTQYQSIASKWLEMLKEAAPSTSRVALIFTPGLVADMYFAPIDEATKVLGITAIRAPYRNTAELETAIDIFAAEPNGVWS